MNFSSLLIAAAILTGGAALAQSNPDSDGDGRGASCERGNASFCTDGGSGGNGNGNGGAGGGGGNANVNNSNRNTNRNSNDSSATAKQGQAQGQLQGQLQGQKQQANGGSSAASSVGPAGSGNVTNVTTGGTYYNEPYVLPAPQPGNNSIVGTVSCPTTLFGITAGTQDNGSGGYGWNGNGTSWAVQAGITVPLGVGGCHHAQKLQKLRMERQAAIELVRMCREVTPEEAERFEDLKACRLTAD